MNINFTLESVGTGPKEQFEDRSGARLKEQASGSRFGFRTKLSETGRLKVDRNALDLTQRWRLKTLKLGLPAVPALGASVTVGAGPFKTFKTRETKIRKLT
jgi:hypothetical protein